MTSFVRDPFNWIRLGAVILALTLVLPSARDLLSGSSEPLEVSPAPSPDVGSRLVAETNGAISFWETRIVNDPQDFIAANKLADLYLRRSQQSGDVADIGRAEAALLVSLDVLPSRNYEAEVVLAHVYNLKHEFGRALTLSQSVVATYPNEDFGWGVLGDAQLALGRYDEAESSYERMAVLAPGLSSFGRMANVADIQGDPERARLHWRNALSEERGDLPEAKAWANAQFGNLEFGQGDLDAAEQHFEASLIAFPDNTPALAGLARVAAARGSDAQAIELYEQVVNRNPQPIDAIALGDLHARAGDEVAASQQYELVRAIGRLYEANGIRFDLTMILFEADHGDALAALERAQLAYAERPSIYVADALGWSLFRAGRLDEARIKAEEALRFGTQDASFLFHAGMIAAAQGDASAARIYLEQALRLNPEFHVLQAEEARAALDRLEAVRAP